MDDLRGIVLLILLAVLSSCSRVSYLTNQGVGQIKLIATAKANSEVINDESIALDKRQKIKKIEEYRDYYYRYWAMEPGSIYSKTTVLENDAVTYLVIASNVNEISPKEECFPVMGCFPYLGFFSEDDAKKHAAELEKENYITWIRPVYAYSSLGYLSDPILTSFFKYEDYDLAEMIFHELFHTMFFIKDDVDFNENLANFVAREMAFEFFELSTEERKRKQLELELDGKQRSLLVDFISELKLEYKSSGCSDRDSCNRVLSKQMKESFDPKVEKLCRDNKCWLKNGKWNNASFAAFLTYEKSGEFLTKIYKKSGSNPKKFYSYISKQYDIYSREKHETTFTQFLLSRE